MTVDEKPVSPLTKANPCVAIAEVRAWAVSEVSVDMSMTGIFASGLLAASIFENTQSYISRRLYGRICTLASSVSYMEIHVLQEV